MVDSVCEELIYLQSHDCPSYEGSRQHVQREELLYRAALGAGVVFRCMLWEWVLERLWHKLKRLIEGRCIPRDKAN